MKKILLSLGLIGIFGGIAAFASANTSCKDVEFPNGVTACVNIEKVGTDRRSLSTSVNNGSIPNLKCDLMTPNSSLRSISSCNGEFWYDGNKIGRMKLWIRDNEIAPINREDKPNNNSERTYPQWIYDFDNEERANDNLTDSNNNSDNFLLTASPNDPNQDEAVDITIKARDNTTTDTSYRGTARFKVERKSGSSRITASSSLYELARTSYTFTSSDDGEHTFSNLVTFNDDSYDYRLVVYDDDNTIESTKTFTLNGGSNTNYNTDNFYLSTDDTTPTQNQYVDLTIKARDNTTTDTSYRGSVDFEVRYRASGTTYWTKVSSNNSLGYYEMKYPYETNGYAFNSSNNGIITITDFIRFKKTDYEYKVIVIDSDYSAIKGEKIFSVGSADTNTTSDNLYITTDDSTPATFQRVDLTVKSRDGTSTDTSYRGTVQFEVYKKASNSTAWTLTTSSTDYEMKSTYANGYRFTSSNAGQKTFTDIIRFKRNNYSYKVLVYDKDNESVEGYKIFEVGTTNSSSSNVNGFSSSQLNTVQSLYNAWNDMISKMENAYPSLRNNTRRQNMSDDLQNAMQEIINDESTKTYYNFTDFYNAFLDRYRYTVSVR